MKIKVNTLLDTTREINLLTLKPLERIKVSFISWGRTTTMYKNRMNRLAEKEYKRKSDEEDSLKEEILPQLYQLFTPDALEVILDFDRSDFPIFLRIKEDTDFFRYEIEILEEDPDFLKCFSSLPVLVKFKLRRVGDD